LESLALGGLFGNWDNIGDFLNIAIMRIIPALLCITIHELAHGFAAYKLGDRTAKDLGRLTLNPIKHIDPLGLLMMLLIGFGWAKPVPVDMRNFKHPKWYMAISAFAGPFSNILLAVVVMFILGLVADSLGVLVGLSSLNVLFTNDLGGTIYMLIINTVILSIGLAVFNMLPIPPLDGSKVVLSLLPANLYYKILRYERYGIILLLVLMNSGLLFNIDIFSNTVGVACTRNFGTITPNAFFVAHFALDS